MRNWIKLCIIGLFLGLGLRIKTVKGEVSTITQPDEILVWFVEVDDFGNPIWKDVDGDPTNNDCVIYAICIFKPLYRGGLPNPEAIPFESDYLPVVVGEEIGNVNIEAVKAQAVAARSYALYNMNNVPSYCTDSCHVTQSTSHQYYNPDRTTSKSILGVTETNKEYLVYPENSAIMPIQTEFSRDHYGLFTKYGGTEYLSSIYDPITTGDDGYSHGRGMSQLGAMKWADGDNWYGVSFPRWSYRRILAHYYTKTQMISAQGNNVWGLYRWNLLQTFPSSGASLKAGKEQSIEIHAQNTGYSTWPSNLEMRIKWYRYDTYLQYDGETGWTVGTLPYNDTTLSPGVHMSLTPVFTPPDSIYWGKNSRYTYCAELGYVYTIYGAAYARAIMGNTILV